MTDLDQHLSAVVAGNLRAFTVWLSHAEPLLRDSLRRFSASVDTEAVLQETLLRIWQVAPRFRPDGRPNGLLRLGFRIARNLAISGAPGLRPGIVDPDRLEATLPCAEDIEAKSPDPMLRRTIKGCQQRLPDKHGQAISARLNTGGGEPDAVLAERLGMETNTFLQSVTRARRFFRECLQRQGIDLDVEPK